MLCLVCGIVQRAKLLPKMSPLKIQGAFYILHTALEVLSREGWSLLSSP